MLLDHRAQHGRQEHVHPPGRADHAAGADRQLRPGRGRRRSASPTASSPASAPATSSAAGQSTFMVEMTETANILNNATPREPGDPRRDRPRHQHLRRRVARLGDRRALHDRVGCRTLFATHYHELTELAKTLAACAISTSPCASGRTRWCFYKIIAGAADKSYGIHVARLAGVPRPVNERAKDLFAQLEDQSLDEQGRAKLARQRPRRGAPAITLRGGASAAQRTAQVNLDETAPLAAWQLLQRWQSEIGGERNGDKP